MSTFLSRAPRGGRRGTGRRIQGNQRQKYSPYGLNRVSGGGVARKRGAESTKWGHDLFQVMNNENDNFTSQRVSSTRTRGDVRHIESGARVYVSNLHPDIELEGLIEILEEAGGINRDRSHINYDQSGQSLRTAQISFTTRSAADNAIQQFHNAEVDGRIIKVTLNQTGTASSMKCFECGGIGHLARECPSATRRSGSINKLSSVVVTPTRTRGSYSRSSTFSTRRGRGRAQGRNTRNTSFLKRTGTGGPTNSGFRKTKTTVPTSENLDSEMDSYWSSNT